MEAAPEARPRLVVILLARHAQAGRRGTAGPDDSRRPLDERGRQQAAALAAMLSGRPLTRIATSPYRRCVETIEPLARAVGLEIELHDELAEGAPLSDVLALIADHDDEQSDMVLCTHGDVIEEMIGRSRPAEKGSVWVLDPERDLEPRRYMLPE
jgi:phosphohistidine phosphatase SixA